MNTEKAAVRKKAYLKVLIINDFDLTRSFLRGILRSRQGEGPREGKYDTDRIAYVAQSTPGVIRLDWYMPEMTSVETLNVMRNVLPETNILMITINNQSATIQAAMDDGTQKCMPHAFDDESSINSILSELPRSEKKNAAIIHMLN